jgi:hypothetical protein
MDYVIYQSKVVQHCLFRVVPFYWTTDILPFSSPDSTSNLHTHLPPSASLGAYYFPSYALVVIGKENRHTSSVWVVGIDRPWAKPLCEVENDHP